jgi:drug/metabolite transporter (DMT)-like permease
MPDHVPRFNVRGLTAALLTPTFLGFAPIFGKLAYQSGSDPFTVAATRTVVAALILWIIYALFWRRYIYIFPAGLLGCVVVGMTNGVGSLFYYGGLQYLDASVVQLLNATYLIFVVVLARLGGQPLKQRTIIRVTLAMIAVVLLTGGITHQLNWLGAGLIMGNAILFAGTVIMSQRVLYEMPAQTFTLYVLTTMAIVVVMARGAYRLEWIPQSPQAIAAIFALGITTALSRLTLFMGVRQLGTLQTVLISVLETAFALVMAFVFLNEQLSPIQWIGVAILLVSLFLVQPGDLAKRQTSEIPIFNLAGMTFQRDAFRKAFTNHNGLKDLTPEEQRVVELLLHGTTPPVQAPDDDAQPTPAD